MALAKYPSVGLPTISKNLNEYRNNKTRINWLKSEQNLKN